MIRSIVVAIADNGVIGRNNQLPWERIPEDMRWFRKVTMGHWLVMGRRTWESIDSTPLPGRESVVVTRTPGYPAPGAHVVNSLDEAWRLPPPDDEVMILGGSEIFRATLPIADRIYLTRVHGSFEGDVHFPPFDPSEWHARERRDVEAGDSTPYPLTFQILERSAAAAEERS